MGTGAPSGTVTFLFTDIEGSTRLWDSAPELMRVALERHDSILRSAIEGREGYVFSTGGDGFAAAFARAGEAVAAAVEAQRELTAATWPEGATLRVRMGLHTGEAAERDGDYFGTAVNRAARLMATAHGGQVVCSRSTRDVASGVVAVRSLGEHRLRDLAAAEQVYQVVDDVFPPLRSVDVVPTNLPTTRTELLGRSTEVATLAALSARERLITLTGVGGVGKTRLALGVAAAVAPDYGDGCWLVDLAPVSDGDEVPLAAAAAMRAPVTDAAALVNYLGDRRMLVVLDNCEHVIGVVAELVDEILEAASEVHVVATSREPLGLDGEVVRRVNSLDTAADDATVEEALDTPAVRLFVDRAEAVADRFVLNDSTVGPVVEICHRLDGIPLALELAAARMRSMPPEEISRRLDERFRLLSGGSRRAQERHRTLAATVSWSHDLLSTADQAVFRRLAVFPASFDMDAAEAVATDDDGQWDVVDSLLGLVDRSLVQFDPERGRYRLLETLRQYAADRLADGGETERTRERHARYFLDLVEVQAEPLLDGRYQTAASILALELDNLRSMAMWCIDQAHWADLYLCCERSIIFLTQEAPADAVDWLQQVVDHRSDVDDQTIVDALGMLAWDQHNCLGDFARSKHSFSQSTEIADAQGLPHSAWAWTARGAQSLQEGRYDDALANGARGLELADARGPNTLGTINLAQASNALAAVGQTERAKEAVAEALRRAEREGHPLAIEAAIIVASANCLFGAEPDFQSSMDVFSGHPDLFHLGSGNDQWLNAFFGMDAARTRRRTGGEPPRRCAADRRSLERPACGGVGASPSRSCIRPS